MEADMFSNVLGLDFSRPVSCALLKIILNIGKPNLFLSMHFTLFYFQKDKPASQSHNFCSVYGKVTLTENKLRK